MSHDQLRDLLRRGQPDADRADDASQPLESGAPKRGRTREQKRALRKASKAPKSSTGVPDHLIRQLALLALFELDVTDHSYDEVISRVIDDPWLAMSNATDEDAPDTADEMPAEAHADRARLERGVRALVYGVIDGVASLDATIVRAAPALPIERIGTIDRNVLRLGIHELETNDASAAPAIINDAVELAKRFGGDSSAGFVNGVLRTINEGRTSRSSTS